MCLEVREAQQADPRWPGLSLPAGASLNMQGWQCSHLLTDAAHAPGRSLAQGDVSE